MDGHVRILAWLFIAFGALGAIAAIAMLFLFGGIAGLVGIANVDDPDAKIAIPILGGIGVLVFLFLLAISLPEIFAGMGLLKYRGWARILAIFLSILNLFNFPLGTLLGVYGLWVLFNKETEALFQKS